MAPDGAGPRAHLLLTAWDAADGTERTRLLGGFERIEGHGFLDARSESQSGRMVTAARVAANLRA